MMTEQPSPYQLSLQVVAVTTAQITVIADEYYLDELAREIIEQYGDDLLVAIVSQSLWILAPTATSPLTVWLSEALREKRITSYICRNVTQYVARPPSICDLDEVGNT